MNAELALLDNDVAAAAACQMQGDKLMQLMDGVIDNRNVPLLSLLAFEKVPCDCKRDPSDGLQLYQANL